MALQKSWTWLSNSTSTHIEKGDIYSGLLLLLLSRFSHVRLRWQPTRLPHPWDSPGNNTGVGCHFLLQYMKVKSEVAQSCPTLSDPLDCSPPGSSVHGIFQARGLEWVASAFSARACYLSPNCKEILLGNSHSTHMLLESSDFSWRAGCSKTSVK